VNFLEIVPFSETDYAVDSIYPISDRFKERVTVGGTIFAGGSAALKAFKSLYIEILDEADKRGVFKGKDQNMYAFGCLRRPDIFNIVKNRVHYYYDEWFSLHHMWAADADTPI
jgi:hypothetical protein